MKATFNEAISWKNEQISKEALKKAVITANKANIGHATSGAGGIEIVNSALQIKHGVIPKILNLEEPCDTQLNFAMG